MNQDGYNNPRTALSTPSEKSPGPDYVDQAGQKKQDDIRTACAEGNIPALQQLAESEGGLLTDSLRQLAWPILLGLPAPTVNASNEKLAESDDDDGRWKELPHHRDEDQVQLDVNRSFVYYPHNLSESDLERRRSQLSALISEVLRTYPYLCYFQGYHDICQVFLLVLRPALAARCVARLSVLRIRDFMLPNLGPTTSQLRLLPDILSRADPTLRRHVATVEPFYALAGTLTMYAHNIEAYRDIARLFDVLLAREPVFSIYLFAQIVVDRRDEILAIDEPDLLQVILARVPARMDLDGLVARAALLFAAHPPETLPAWRRIARASALKTARDPRQAARQTLRDGAAWFDTQAKELQWLDLRNSLLSVAWAYRRPAKTVAMAVAVGLVAFYVRRNSTLVNYVVSFFS
ncbi:RabGAP/TBC [Cordyceps militaris CM01]|uniref:RabGAP/TBC n=1 Tax=Cordyceps militaris (strain CM01) TaxID=983644 RepID=G3JCS8_CORMM|nr:RabGAP/TBC [Cordyceps militaris CM01]EGX94686.1 RabGAP/TBC [Cordyceps militaris CM01]